MKKITLVMMLLCLGYIGYSQVLNEPSGWPNTNWTVTGDFAEDYLYENPTTSTSFSFNDDQAGDGSNNTVGAESPLIDLTAAYNAGETWLYLDFSYVFRNLGNEVVNIEYWDADAAAWTVWQVLDQNTAGAPNADFCNGPVVEETTEVLSFYNFSATQLANFRYRLVYDDGDVFAYGFCFSDLTLYSATPPACSEPINVVVGDVDYETAELSWETLVSSEGYTVEYGVAGFEQGTGTATTTTTTAITLNNLVADTAYEFYVQANCAGSNVSEWVGPFSFETTVITDYTVDCTVGATNFTYCYDDNDENIFHFQGSDETLVLAMTVNAGLVENTYDEFIVYDSDGSTELYNGFGNGGDLSGLTFYATGNDIYFRIVSDNVTNCVSDFQTPLDIDVYCLDCVLPTITYESVQDCTNPTSPMFTVEVTIDEMGSANAITITDDQGSDAQTANATGVYTFGPYEAGTEVVLNSVNDDSENCFVTSEPLTTGICTEYAVDCAAGPTNFMYCYENNDENIFHFSSNNTEYPLALYVNSGSVENNYDEFIVYDSDGTTELYNGYGNAGDLSGLMITATGNELYIAVEADGVFDCSSSDNIETLDIDVFCMDCTVATVDFESVQDCTNPSAPVFTVDVTVDDFGSASSLTLTDDQGSEAQTVSETGVYTFGPYDYGTEVVVTATNDDSANCFVNSNPLTTDICTEYPVDCAVGPTNFSYCYENNDTNIFHFTSNNDTFPVGLIVNSGSVENNYDEFIVYDSDGTTELYNGYGNTGDLSGLTIIATGNEIYVRVQADGSNNCQTSESIESLDIDVFCLECEPLEATFETIQDCSDPVNATFTVDVNISDLGSATSVVISDDQDTEPLTVSETGIYTFGPYDFGTEVVVRAENVDDEYCFAQSDVLTTDVCTEYPVDCAVGPTNFTYCYENNDDHVFHFEGTNEDYPIAMVINAGTVENNWDLFTVYDSDGTTVLYSGYGDEGNLAGINLTASGNELYIAIDSDGGISCDSGSQTSWDINVYCLDCTPPSVTYDIIQDCQIAENNTFSVAVAITDLGEATSVTIQDNLGTAPVTVSEPGTYEYGDYAYGTEVSVTTQNVDNSNCTVYSMPLTNQTCPPIDVSTDEYTVEELVTDVLINSECAQIDNITWSGASTFNQTDNFGNPFESLGYFSEGGGFAFQEGLVLTTGDIAEVPGPNGSLLGAGSTLTWPGDDDLSEISGEPNLYNATYIQFDFIPYSNNISFDFIFASEEYTSTFECDYSDIFAFILTDQDGNSTNIALVPGTDTPVMVTTVHGDSGSLCGPINEEFFAGYNANGEGQIDFNGQTGVMTAQSAVVPGQTYTIKLAIADALDGNYDSAVFIKAGSFDLGSIDLGSDYLVADQTALCEGEEITLDAGTVPDNASIVWLRDGAVIADATDATLTVTEAGDYAAQVTYDGTTCSFEDTVSIEFYALPEISVAETEISKCLREDLTLIVNVDNANELSADLNFDWYNNGELIQSGSLDTYELLAGDPMAGTFTIVVTDNQSNGCSAEISIELSNGYCAIPQGISPQGDDYNQNFDLSGLNVGRLEIFNRLGKKVYTQVNYTDQWHGQTDEGELLPVGTYFYVINIADSDETITGWVYVNY